MCIRDRIQRIKERRTVGRTSALDRGDTRRTRTERTAYHGTEDAAQRISDLEREIKRREQSREYSSIKEPVSYTHLDVYKRQDFEYTGMVIVDKGTFEIAYYVERGSYDSDGKDAVDGLINEACLLYTSRCV